MKIAKILVPIMFTDGFHDVAIQATWLQRHFCAEIILLHVVPPLQKRDGVLESLHQMKAQGLDVQIVRQAEENLDRALRAEIKGNAVTRLLLKGTAGRQIMKVAGEQSVDLIMMTTHDRWRMGSGGSRAFYRFLLGSVTAMVLEQAECPVWVGLSQPNKSASDFSIRHILCLVDFSFRDSRTISLAAELAAAIDAKISLVHITTGAECFGPGGSYIDPRWKMHFERIAAKNIAKIQEDMGINADVIIDSGNVPKLLNRIAEQTCADLLVVGKFSTQGYQGDAYDGFKIVKETRIPVLSV